MFKGLREELALFESEELKEFKTRWFAIKTSAAVLRATKWLIGLPIAIPQLGLVVIHQLAKVLITVLDALYLGILKITFIHYLIGKVEEAKNNLLEEIGKGK